MNDLVIKLSNPSFIYGPLTKEQAFSVGVPCKATVVEEKWYVGTQVELTDDFYKNLKIYDLAEIQQASQPAE